MLINCKKIGEIAEVYRVADGQKIPPGTSLIRLSANDGTVLYVEVEETGKTGYVAFSPWSNVLPRYLYFALQNAMPEFLAKYKSGINLKYEAVKFLKINVPTMEQQKQIIEVLMTIEKAERTEQKEIETLKGFKEGMLEQMFVSEERKG